MTDKPASGPPRERWIEADIAAAVAASPLAAKRVETLRAMLRSRDCKWGLWATLYCDASNAGGSAWGWGSKGQINHAIAELWQVPSTLAHHGPLPEVTVSRSHLAETWAIVHAVRHALQVWPFLRGVGVRSDNEHAVWAATGCDGRSVWTDQVPPMLSARGFALEIDAARSALADLLRPRGVKIRAEHVHGHERADRPEQRSFNRCADKLAREAARRRNEGSEG